MNEKIRDLRNRLEQTRRSLTKAEIERDGAKDRLQRVVTLLREEFGVENGPDAKRKLEELKADLDRLIGEANAALEKVNR